MDLICTGNRDTPFVDYKTYPKMCFGCFNVPKTEEQLCDLEGNLVECRELPYSPKHLFTPEQLFSIGAVSTKEEAKQCVIGVKEAIKRAKISKKTPVLKPPSDARTYLNPNNGD